MGETRHRPARQGFSLGRVIPLLVLGLGLALFFAFDLQRFLSCAALAQHNEMLHAFAARPWAPLGFVLIYALAVAFSLPGGAVMTVAGGFMFGQVLGTAYAVVAATLGATALFLIARTALGDLLRARAGPAIKRMEAGFQENALSYLLVLRLIPLFPFWLVNLVPAFLGVSLRSFVIGTFLGIIPGTFVFATIGAGLESVISQGEACSLAGALTPQVVMALVGLALLALLPVAYKWIKRRRG
jgi:uncharacterized membrane protein YdjX (TVP38/TMEM64 family)